MYNVIYDYSGLIYNISENSSTQREVITTDAENKFSHWSAEHGNFNPASAERSQKKTFKYLLTMDLLLMPT